MKLGKGEAIICSRGHQVGDVLADVQDDEPVPTAALRITQTLDGRYACERCDEAVAHRIDDDRWRVRTSRGWVT